MNSATSVSNAAGIQILLATFNSGHFLPQQLDSLIRQNDSYFQIIIRDGGSTDNTLEIIRRFQKEHPDIVRYLGTGRAKAMENFRELLRHADSDYVMFCDHDDIWHPDKVSRTLTVMQEAEGRYGRKMPLLVHSNLRVCDKQLDELSPSFFQYQNLNAQRNQLSHLMVQNIITGCTVMMNRALAAIARIPDEAICHDWYLGLLAAAFGKIIFIPDSLIDYRQHRHNVYGAVKYGPRLLNQVFQHRHLHRHLLLTQRQAGAFLKLNQDKLSADQQQILRIWSNMDHFSKMDKIKNCLKYHFRKNTLVRTLGMWWAL